jgi:hypothetical protein
LTSSATQEVPTLSNKEKPQQLSGVCGGGRLTRLGIGVSARAAEKVRQEESEAMPLNSPKRVANMHVREADKSAGTAWRWRVSF